MEYQFLDYDYGELETPSAAVSPEPGQPIVFNFRKGQWNRYTVIHVHKHDEKTWEYFVENCENQQPPRIEPRPLT